MIFPDQTSLITQIIINLFIYFIYKFILFIIIIINFLKHKTDIHKELYIFFYNNGS